MQKFEITPKSFYLEWVFLFYYAVLLLWTDIVCE